MDLGFDDFNVNSGAMFTMENNNTAKKAQVYTRFDFEREVFGMDIVELTALFEYKKNIILQGAPGVGKTYTAKRLAYSMMGYKDEDRVMQVQFHQSYTYDDFVMGLKPTEDGGFKFDFGPFYNICKKAQDDPEHRDYFIIIDEINRGNLYIIGTMNTADRGLVMLDYALRRRFAFYTVGPQYKSEGFRQLMIQSNNLKFNKRARKIVDLNKAISLDDMLGPGFQVGHSYFCLGRPISEQDLRYIIDYEIMPLLEEYWYDSEEKIVFWKNAFDTILNN